ncbi:MAG: hypothetical protein IPO91_19775 [Chloroflexi bacterium]|nr:hypothetical protein [Chloroflexota bacterium]
MAQKRILSDQLGFAAADIHHGTKGWMGDGRLQATFEGSLEGDDDMDEPLLEKGLQELTTYRLRPIGPLLNAQIGVL